MLISVVIPVFNRHDCISRAIASALKLGESLAEVVVVDDASTDGSTQVIRDCFPVELERGKLILLELDQNAGVTAARNAAIQFCSGKWLAFLDSDDRLVEECVVPLVAELEAADNHAIVFFRCVDSRGNLIGNAPLLPALISAAGYLRDWKWGECLPLVRAQAFRENQFEKGLRGFEGLAYARIMRSEPGAARVAGIVAREYETERPDRISTSNGKMARAGGLSRGYWKLVREFPRELGVVGCGLAVLKVGYYAFLCGAEFLVGVGRRTSRSVAIRSHRA